MRKDFLRKQFSAKKKKALSSQKSAKKKLFVNKCFQTKQIIREKKEGKWRKIGSEENTQNAKKKLKRKKSYPRAAVQSRHGREKNKKTAVFSGGFLKRQYGENARIKAFLS